MKRVLTLACCLLAAGLSEFLWRARLRAQSPPAGFDIYAIGGSTTLGDPYVKASFPFLTGKIMGRPFNLVNLARGGHSVYPQAYLLHRALKNRAHDNPGVVLIYAGHNEGYLLDDDKIPSLWEAPLDSRWARASHLLGTLAYHFEMKRHERGFFSVRRLSDYERRLRMAIETSLDAGMRPVLSTVVSDMSDIEPTLSFRALESAGAVLKRGRELERDGRGREAIAHYRGMLDDVRVRAYIHYRIGRVQQVLGDLEGAKASYQSAVDTDLRETFGRATSAQNALIRRLAAEYGVPLVDAVALFAAASPEGLVGRELMIDGHHPNLKGTILLADAFARAAAGALGSEPLHPSPTEAVVRDWAGLSADDDEQALVVSGYWLLRFSCWHPYPEEGLRRAAATFARAVRLAPGKRWPWLTLGAVQWLSAKPLPLAESDLKRLRQTGLMEPRVCPDEETARAALRLFDEGGVPGETIVAARRLDGC